MLKERHQLTKMRLESMISEDEIVRPYGDYFVKMARRLLLADTIYDTESPDLDQLRLWNREWYQDILPEHYEKSYGNPDFICKAFDQSIGHVLGFIYCEIMGTIIYALEDNLYDLTIVQELFLEVYHYFQKKEARFKQIKRIITDYMHDYCQYETTERIRQQLCPGASHASSIVMGDLSDSRCLYRYGVYISKNETDMFQYLNSLPREDLQTIAATFTNGFRDGFAINGIDMRKKKTVNIRYSVGFEPVVVEAIAQFKEMGLESILYLEGISAFHKGMNRIGIVSTQPNPQYDYDHRFDFGLFFEKGYFQHKLECTSNAYETWKKEAAVFAGPACIETFGHTPFLPQNKNTAMSLLSKQQQRSVILQVKSGEIVNDYCPPEERSFTIIAFPVPQIGQDFSNIFKETMRINTLDKEKYQLIQQKLIDALNQGMEVHIKGAGENRTDLYVALNELSDPQKETNFENCLADVNIPLGEVFTSPKLHGTNGVLHVSEVYLREMKFRDLMIHFEQGMVEYYTCSNFEDEAQNHAYIKEYCLYNRETLPMGEFAIGTNTTAYAMAKKYGILPLLPILIVEKMGPHFAVGDTCYSHSEETRIFNPDGREMIAKHNAWSASGEYFHCHTDITLPYDELDSISVILPGGDEIVLISGGKFVLPGTEELNEPL